MPDLVPGWYKDPADPSQERFWDGVTWTHWTRGAASVQGSTPTPLREPKSRPVDDSTRSAWLIATSPAWCGGGFLVLSAFARVSSLGSAAAVGLVLLSAVAVFVLSFRDRTELAGRGVVRPASPLWSLASPLAYLIARHVATRGYRASADLFLPTFVVLAIPVVALIRYTLS